MSARPRFLVIGVGNSCRNDDGAGLAVAQRLKELATNDVAVLQETGDGSALIQSWKDSDVVIIVDAVFSAAKPGTIHRFDGRTQRIPRELFRYSTHTFGVAEAIELARALNQLPPRLIVYGIEGKDFQAGVKLSPEVQGAVSTVLGTLLSEIGEKSIGRH